MHPSVYTQRNTEGLLFACWRVAWTLTAWTYASEKRIHTEHYKGMRIPVSVRLHAWPWPGSTPSPLELCWPAAAAAPGAACLHKVPCQHATGTRPAHRQWGLKCVTWSRSNIEAGMQQCSIVNIPAGPCRQRGRFLIPSHCSQVFPQSLPPFLPPSGKEATCLPPACHLTCSRLPAAPNRP